MKRLFSRILRSFWSWGFLKFVLFALTLFVLLYVEEDWRGARAWAATKAKWEDKGGTFNLGKFTPPPVPDAQNIAAIPLFKMERFAEETGKTLYPVALRRAMRSGQAPGGDLPSRGNWMRGELPDMSKIGNTIAADYTAAFPGVVRPQTTLEQWNSLYPFLSDLRSAALTRPFCRLDLDYTTSPPDGRTLGLLTDQIRLSQILTTDAILALDQHQADVALEDIKINYKLLSGTKGNPTLVGGLVAIGINAIDGAALYDGLAQHAWNDAQLAGLEQMLERIDFLVTFQFDFRAEAADSVTNIDFFKHLWNPNIYGMFQLPEEFKDENISVVRVPFPWPGGWWDENKSLLGDFNWNLLATVDPESHRAFPEEATRLEKEVKGMQKKWDAGAPWRIWFTLASAPLASQTMKFAYAQAWIDEARIACALERFRLARGAYPPALEALSPEYIELLPRDVINGEPYRFRVKPDGTFLLYSVGWNQADEGGRQVFSQSNPKLIDNMQGDWPWPVPKK